MYMAEPFFSICLPRRGSSMGSKYSLASSKMTGMPFWMEDSRYLFMILGSMVGLIQMIFLESSFFLIQMLACIWGSIMRGHLSEELSRMMALSMEKESLGSLSTSHCWILTSWPRTSLRLMISLLLIANFFTIWIQLSTQSCLYLCSNTPRYAMIPELIRMSPTRFSLLMRCLISSTSQILFSLPSFSIRLLALSNFLLQSSICAFSRSSSCFVAVNSSISCFIWASTALSRSMASSHSRWASLEDSCATFSCSCLGLTTFMASSYCTIARTHFARPQAALDTFLSTSSW
mmetsp:Transcript_9721/g.9415  ORF Transcript_9721/g.9415 Transcript_9721/m.9415 type:complete len:290 (+) Transcript_9721:2961-3830(+)